MCIRDRNPPLENRFLQGRGTYRKKSSVQFGIYAIRYVVADLLFKHFFLETQRIQSIVSTIKINTLQTGEDKFIIKYQNFATNLKWCLFSYICFQLLFLIN